MNHRIKQGFTMLVIVLCLSGCIIPYRNAANRTASFAQPDCPHLECWDGIVPGSTTFEEAKRLLIEKYGEQNVIINSRRNSISWESNNEADRFNGGLVIRISEQGLIPGMILTFDQLTIAELTAQLGEPSLVYVGHSHSDEFPCSGVLVRYPNRAVNAWLHPEYEITSIGIIPTQEIYMLELMSTEAAEDYKISSHRVVEWQGYTDYCKLAFPEAFETAK